MISRGFVVGVLLEDSCLLFVCRDISPSRCVSLFLLFLILYLYFFFFCFFVCVCVCVCLCVCVLTFNVHCIRFTNLTRKITRKIEEADEEKGKKEEGATKSFLLTQHTTNTHTQHRHKTSRGRLS